MTNRHRHQYEVARNLRLRERLSCIHAGTSGLDRRLLEEKIVAPILTGTADDGGSLLRTETSRIKTIRQEVRKIDRQLPALARNVKAAQVKLDDSLATHREVEESQAPSYGSVWSRIPAVAIILFDTAVAFLALSDAAGLDLSHGFDDLPLSTAFLLGSFSILVSFTNVQAGFLATSPVSPRRRLLGATLLLLIAGALAVIRAASVAGASIAVAFLGALVTILAGVVGGVLQRKLLPVIMAHREHRQKLALANKAIAEAQEKIAFAKAEVQKAELQKRALIAETASLEGKPRERASQRTDLDQIQEARRKAVRYYYALGCRFAGKGTKNQEGSDA